MNKRIEELAIKTFFDESTNGGNQKMYTFGEDKMQLFAELIVQECADLCLKYAECEGPFNTIEFRKGQHFNTIIKEHFEVKE